MALDQSDELLKAWFWTNRLSEGASLTEPEIRDIAEVLSRTSNAAWSRIPRIYSVLMLIGQTQAIDAFISEDVTDMWFPFSAKSLPTSLSSPSVRLDFLAAQHLVYDLKALALEGRDTRHGHFADPKAIPLQKIGELGKGGFGFVDRVRSTISNREYARKLIPRGRTFKKDREVLRSFERELCNLKRLSHHAHIVQLVGSYTDPRYVGILMSPVADCNLSDFLSSTLGDAERSLLRTFFGCLTSALTFLHNNRVRHKDIKPQNILVKKEHVFLTDFGTSLDWTGLNNSVTTGPTWSTPRYSPPEVSGFAARNSLSDIWSLGCVFLEMWTVLKKTTIQSLHTHLETNGKRSTQYHSNLGAVFDWCNIVQALPGLPVDNTPSTWIQHMLIHDRDSRWSAHTLAENIYEYSNDPSSPYAFSGLCCLDNESSAESVYSSAEEDTNDRTVKPSLAPNPIPTLIEPSDVSNSRKQAKVGAKNPNKPLNATRELVEDIALQSEESLVPISKALKQNSQEPGIDDIYTRLGSADCDVSRNHNVAEEESRPSSISRSGSNTKGTSAVPKRVDATRQAYAEDENESLAREIGPAVCDTPGAHALAVTEDRSIQESDWGSDPDITDNRPIDHWSSDAETTDSSVHKQSNWSCDSFYDEIDSFSLEAEPHTGPSPSLHTARESSSSVPKVSSDTRWVFYAGQSETCAKCGKIRNIRSMTQIDCGHDWCGSCIRRVFERALNNPGSILPRCCNPGGIQWDYVRHMFDVRFRERWRKTFDAFSPGNVVYCPQVTCTEILNVWDIEKGSLGERFVRCGLCLTEVCLECQQARAIHNQQGCFPVRRCYGCRELVEVAHAATSIERRQLHEKCVSCGGSCHSYRRMKCYLCGCVWNNCIPARAHPGDMQQDISGKARDSHNSQYAQQATSKEDGRIDRWVDSLPTSGLPNKDRWLRECEPSIYTPFSHSSEPLHMRRRSPSIAAATVASDDPISDCGDEGPSLAHIYEPGDIEWYNDNNELLINKARINIDPTLDIFPVLAIVPQHKFAETARDPYMRLRKYNMHRPNPVRIIVAGEEYFPRKDALGWCYYSPAPLREFWIQDSTKEEPTRGRRRQRKRSDEPSSSKQEPPEYSPVYPETLGPEDVRWNEWSPRRKPREPSPAEAVLSTRYNPEDMRWVERGEDERPLPKPKLGRTATFAY